MIKNITTGNSDDEAQNQSPGQLKALKMKNNYYF